MLSTVHYKLALMVRILKVGMFSCIFRYLLFVFTRSIWRVEFRMIMGSTYIYIHKHMLKVNHSNSKQKFCLRLLSRFNVSSVPKSISHSSIRSWLSISPFIQFNFIWLGEKSIPFVTAHFRHSSLLLKFSSTKTEKSNPFTLCLSPEIPPKI